MTKVHPFLLGLAATTMLIAPARGESSKSDHVVESGDPLLRGFEAPPPEARPRVWWHWMNGNITKEGLVRDLDWMQRIGIGGVQIFDANLATPQVVPHRLAYMTPEWKDAFGFAVGKAADLGMEVAIAASPGWSETGGPWVKPDDGIKKLVWSETTVSGGRRFRGTLARPPAIAGPYHDLAAEHDLVASAKGEKQFEVPAIYRDVAVFAYRIAADSAMPKPEAIVANGKPLDVELLTDSSLTTAVPVGRGTGESPTILVARYDQPQLVRSLTFFAPGAAEKFGAPGYLPRLEASDDGATWHKITDLALTTVPTTVSFAAVTARQFRVVMTVNPNGGLSGFSPAAGVDFRPVIAIMAPKPTLPIADFRLSREARVNQFEAKAGFATVLDYGTLDERTGPDEGLAHADLIDLTGRLTADGSLDWKPTAGTWRIVRMGWSLTGKTNHPASLEATGLEVDKLDAPAVRRYLENYLAMYRGIDGSKGISALLTDSTEVGAFNWTPGLTEHFRRLRGYDPTPWLPVLTGVVIGSATQSDAFLYDFRKTLAELHASEHYGTVAAFAHENGLKVYGEALEDRRPSLGDDMAMRRYADYPMAALWTWQRGESPRPTLLGDLKGASSTAHLYGQNIAAAESMTSALQYWAHAPADLRRIIDLEFAYGINRPIIHSSVHQPVDDKKPGLSLLIFGQYFNRHETWAKMARPWTDYIARSSYLLQQGRNHADVAYFYGEDTPLTAQFAQSSISDTPKRYAYDFVNDDALLNLLKVDGADLTAPSGARYRVLYLGGTSHRMTLPVLRRVAQLAADGATIVGTAPQGSPALGDDPREYAALVAMLWSGRPVTSLGKGRIIESRNIEQAMHEARIAPDFDYDRSDIDREVLFVHRTLADGEVYFVNNRSNRAETFEARFRVSGRKPMIWRADTGRTEPVSYRIEGNETVVPLIMEAEGSYFVVFRTPVTAVSATVAALRLATVATLDDHWTISFPPDRSAPALLKLRKLAPLNDNPDPAVRYFSGTVTYSKTFRLPKSVRRGAPLLLDLGTIGDVAEISVNGQRAGSLWHAPYHEDISKLVRPGDNTVEVKVANLWVNRLIGDAQADETKRTFTVLPTYIASAPLRPSGLLGPVRLLTVTPP